MYLDTEPLRLPLFLSAQTVQRVSLGSLNAAAQHKPQLIRDHLGTLLPLLYKETEIKPELVRTVQMGPWKQVFDDGLETRSESRTCASYAQDARLTDPSICPSCSETAYETMYTLVSHLYLRMIDPALMLQANPGGLCTARHMSVQD
jgi:hypothetical protein